MKRKIVAYDVIAVETSELGKCVNAALEDGWELYGFPFSDGDIKQPFLCQGVVRYEDRSRE